MDFFDSKECEWSDQEILLDGKKLVKGRGITFKKSVAKEPLYASGDEPISIQRSNKGYAGTLNILKGALRDINRGVKLTGGEDILDAEFVIIVNYKAKGTRAIQSISLIGLEFTEFEDGMLQGDKFKEVAIPFIYLRQKEA